VLSYRRSRRRPFWRFDLDPHPLPRRGLRLSAAAIPFLLTACAQPPLAQQLTGLKFPPAVAAQGPDVAQISFSADKKYETEKGVPFKGDPLICTQQKVQRVNAESGAAVDQIAVTAGEEVAVTSVIAWTNGMFRKLCGPFVAFTPEPGARYVVVNERFGGKGVAALWTGVAFQSCGVSVYREKVDGFERVQIRSVSGTACRGPAE
jgi:hypothetical protein